MENYYDNFINIYGKPESIKSFLDYTGWSVHKIDFNKIIPLPSSEDIKKIIELSKKKKKKKVDMSTINLIRSHLIDSKWGSYEPEDKHIFDFEGYDDSLRINFYTSGGVPDALAKEIRKKFPELEVSWDCLSLDQIDVHKDELPEDVYNDYLEYTKETCDKDEFEEYKQSGYVKAWGYGNPYLFPI